MLDKENRVEFTREMRDCYKILFPNMCDIHFHILQKVFQSYGYDIELLTSTDQSVIDEGLKYVHNDTCYPALLTIGQMIAALKSGKYDVDHTALMMSQTGGGCRASNYIHLLRKALKNEGMEQVPVISISLGMEKNSGFKVTLPLARRAMAAVACGDLLMLLGNQTRPYEVNPGDTDRLINRWIDDISDSFMRGRDFAARKMAPLFRRIVASFDALEIVKTPKIKVGIVGEIYVKYSALANNNLEKFLADEGCEVMVPGLMGFLLYCVINNIRDIELYGGSSARKKAVELLYAYLRQFETALIQAVQECPKFTAPAPAERVRELAEPVIGTGCKMGEGWLLTGEIMELIGHGYENVICAQPFGCLPNHIVGKGMIRKIRTMLPEANIVPIDYDAGATRVNQENRIKLMLAVAGERLRERQEEKPRPEQVREPEPSAAAAAVACAG